MYSIQSNITLPPVSTSGRGAPTKYPFASMKPGDSFDVPVERGKDYRKVMVTVSASCVKAGARSIGSKKKKFCCRSIVEDNLIRVWRIK